MTRWKRRLGSLGVAALAAFATGGCDPIFGAAATNATSADIVVRQYGGSWLLPAHGSGVIFYRIGVPEASDALDFELLDASTCEVLGVQHVDFVAYDSPVIALAPDGTISVSSEPSVFSDGQQLERIDRCL